MKLFLSIILFLFALQSQAQKFGSKVTWDEHSLMFDGKRVVPVMGEIHYSRVPEDEWAAEVRKMKEGGVTVIATYVFWNHIEEQEGVYDWSGQRNLRRFIEICKEEGMPVVLRVGPFCHGEVRCGGIPDWVIDSGCKPRSQDARFMAYAERLYRQIFTQVQGLQWKDGGPLLACQFDNEYRGSGDYLMALKKIALNIGFDLPFYTRTGWPELSKPVPFGEMLPLYGDYADGFWDRSIKEGSGNYWQAFHFKQFRVSTAIASEQLNYSTENKPQKGDENYPYFTCELGGGMMTSYHRRVYLYPEDAYSMALVKLGSGSNLLGYYMYHGGTNPEGKLTYLNEIQDTKATNYNDLPVKTYDFQAPIGEFGQTNPHYYTLRKLHLFMHDFGEMLAPMDAHFPTADKPQKQGDDSYLRWSYRSLNEEKGSAAFVFVNNYARFENLKAKDNVRFDVVGTQFPQKAMTVPAGCMAVLPVNIKLGDITIDYATAQLIANRDGKIYMAKIDGVPAELKVNGRVMKNVKPQGTKKAVYKNIYLLSEDEASHLFLPQTEATTGVKYEVGCTKIKTAGAPRKISIGVNHVAEEPVDEDFETAAIYRITIPANSKTDGNNIICINYQGDCARLYANGRLIEDNFYNGRPMLYGLWRLPDGCNDLELRILPMQKDMPVYFPREADTTPGENVVDISIF